MRPTETVSEPYSGHLRDPGMPEGILRQQAHTLLTACGLSIIVHGPGSLQQCWDHLQRVVPAFGARARTTPGGLGIITPGDELFWVPLTGTRGSAIAVMCGPASDSNFVSDLLLRLQRDTGSGWTASLVNLNGVTSVDVAALIDVAEAIPTWVLPTFAGSRPADADEQIPLPTRDALLRNRGWWPGNMGLGSLKGHVGTGPGGDPLEVVLDTDEDRKNLGVRVGLMEPDPGEAKGVNTFTARFFADAGLRLEVFGDIVTAGYVFAHVTTSTPSADDVERVAAKVAESVNAFLKATATTTWEEDLPSPPRLSFRDPASPSMWELVESAPPGHVPLRSGDFGRIGRAEVYVSEHVKESLPNGLDGYADVNALGEQLLATRGSGFGRVIRSGSVRYSG